jgi:hypothetical protein
LGRSSYSFFALVGAELHRAVLPRDAFSEDQMTMTSDLPQLQPLSANQLRALAEASDSLRNEDACVVVNPSMEPGVSPLIVVSKADADRDHLPVVFSVRTEDRPKPCVRQPLTLRSDQKLQFVKGLAVDINKCDAIFTSLAAVEKFVVPYYARLRGLDDCEALRGSFATNPDLVAMVHLPTSVDDEARVEQSGVYFAKATGDDKQPVEMISVSQFLGFL